MEHIAGPANDCLVCSAAMGKYEPFSPALGEIVKAHYLVDVTEPTAVPQATPPPDRGRLRIARVRGQKRKHIAHQLRLGQTQTIDKAWLLAELMEMYNDTTLKGRDRLSVLELMAKLSGYGGKTVEEPEDERRAIAELMQELDAGK